MMLVLISLAVVAGILVYGLLMYKQQSQAKKDHTAALRQAAATLTEAKQQYAIKDEPIQDIIRKNFTTELSTHVSEETIAVGMPTELLLVSWGEPDHKEPMYDGLAGAQKWGYDPFTGSDKQLKYKTEVIIQKDRVTGWEDFE